MSDAVTPQCPDQYFDDEFGSDRIMARDRHLRLHTTLGLDRSTGMNLSEAFRSPVVDSGRVKTQRKTVGRRAAAGDTAAGGQQAKCATEAGTSFCEGSFTYLITYCLLERSVLSFKCSKLIGM